MHRRSGGVSAAALADVFIDVDPAILQTALEHRAVVLTQTLQRIENRILCIRKFDVCVSLGDKRRVYVVHVQLVYAEQLLAKADIAVHLVEILVDGLNELMIDAGRDLGLIERCLEGGGVVARVGEELELLDVCLQRCGAGVAEALIGFIVCLERILAQDAVGGFQAGNKGSLA